jgi:hypothetical protein
LNAGRPGSASKPQLPAGLVQPFTRRRLNDKVDIAAVPAKVFGSAIMRQLPRGQRGAKVDPKGRDSEKTARSSLGADGA